MSYIHEVGGSIPPWRTKGNNMSAMDPTKKELKDLVTIIVPRVIAEAMNNPEGEWYNDKIIDEAIKNALEK